MRPAKGEDLLCDVTTSFKLKDLSDSAWIYFVKKHGTGLRKPFKHRNAKNALFLSCASHAPKAPKAPNAHTSPAHIMLPSGTVVTKPMAAKFTDTWAQCQTQISLSTCLLYLDCTAQFAELHSRTLSSRSHRCRDWSSACRAAHARASNDRGDSEASCTFHIAISPLCPQRALDIRNVIAQDFHGWQQPTLPTLFPLEHSQKRRAPQDAPGCAKPRLRLRGCDPKARSLPGQSLSASP